MIIRPNSKPLAIRHGRLAFARLAVAPISVYVFYVNHSILNYSEIITPSLGLGS